MRDKIVLYMSGNYAEILKYLPKYLDEYEFIAFNQNYKAHKICFKNKSFSNSFYLFDSFNNHYKKFKNKPIDKTINGFKVLITDKSHFKKLKGINQERIINTMYHIFLEWINQTKPNFIFIPIIESIDSMLLYEISKALKIEVISYCHARHLNVSFFSDSYLELLPPFYKNIKPDESQIKQAQILTSNLKGNREKLSYQIQLKQMFKSFENKDQLPYTIQKNFFVRYLINIKLKLTNERKNQLLLFWIKFQVFIEKMLVPIQKIIYSIFEKYYIKPLNDLPNKFDFFPLHFSPESSINTPAPYYIDQLRVIDKILLEKDNNDILLVKEHPSMFLKRKFSFYKKIKHTPYVRIINKNFNSQKIIDRASSVYSVTGTACMEAYYKNKKWKMLGKNFLSEFIYENTKNSPFDFSISVLKSSGNFILSSPPKEKGIKRSTLFAEQNLINMSNYFRFYIDNLKNFKK